MTQTIAIVIPHCPFSPERVKSLARLKHDLFGDAEPPAHVLDVKVIGEMGPVPNWKWALKVFAFAQETKADRIVQIQDDVLVMPKFLDVLRILHDKLGDETLNCFTIAPWAKAIHAMGARFMTTSDWMTGPCWSMKRERVLEHFRWLHENCEDGAMQAINEDTLLGLSHAAHGWKIVNPIPAIVDHDTALKSNYGNEKAMHNRSSAAWHELPAEEQQQLTDPAYWVRKNPIPGCPGGDIPHFGRVYSHHAPGPYMPFLFCRWTIPNLKPSEDGRMHYDRKEWEERADAMVADFVPIQRSNPQ